MRSTSSPKKISHFPTHSPIHWILSVTLLLLIAIGVLLALTVHTQASSSSSPSTAPSSDKTDQQAGILPETTPTGTIAYSNGASTSVTATPTLLPSASQTTHSGVFSLAAGGPLPVPESVLHPTNIARLLLNTTLISIYAGSMTQNPQAGILCVLRENLATGQLTLQIYQSPRINGPLTILAIQHTRLKISDTKGEGYFDLATNTFQW